MKMETANLRLFCPRESEKLIFESMARFMIMDAGRRWGKTLSAINWLLEGTWKYGGENWWVVPIYKIGRIAWRRLTGCVPKRAIRDCSKVEMRMELISGGSIEIRSADNPENLRGEGLKRLVIDEAARVPRDAWEESLRPSLSDNQGRALFISTPKGRNWFFDLWTKGQDPLQKNNFESWKFPTWDNPKITKADVDQARESLPADVFQQEYEAEFLEDSAGVFRNIKSCIKGILEKPDKDKTYYAGLDLARLTDFTVLSIIDQNKHLVFFDRFNKIDWTYQKARIIESIKNYKAKLLMDSTGIGDPILDDLSRALVNIEGFKFTNESKKDLIQSLAISFEQDKITIPEIKELVNELSIFEYEMTRSGNVRYSAPEGYHDDCVISLALANWCCNEGNLMPGFFFTGGKKRIAA